MTLWTTTLDTAQSQCRRGLRHGACHLSNAPSPGYKWIRTCAPRVHRQRGIPCGQALGMWADTSTGAACNAVPAISSATRAPAPRVHRALRLHPARPGRAHSPQPAWMTLWKTPGHMAQTHSPRGLQRGACDFITMPHSCAMQRHGATTVGPGRVITHCTPALAPACGWMREARLAHGGPWASRATKQTPSDDMHPVHSHRGTPCGKALGMCAKANAGAVCSAMPKISSTCHVRCSASPQPPWKTLWTSPWHVRQSQCRRGLQRGARNLIRSAAAPVAVPDRPSACGQRPGIDGSRKRPPTWITNPSPFCTRCSPSTATVDDPVDNTCASVPKPVLVRAAARCLRFHQASSQAARPNSGLHCRLEVCHGITFVAWSRWRLFPDGHGPDRARGVHRRPCGPVRARRPRWPAPPGSAARHGTGSDAPTARGR